MLRPGASKVVDESLLGSAAWGWDDGQCSSPPNTLLLLSLSPSAFFPIRHHEDDHMAWHGMGGRCSTSHAPCPPLTVEGLSSIPWDGRCRRVPCPRLTEALSCTTKIRTLYWSAWWWDWTTRTLTSIRESFVVLNPSPFPGWRCWGGGAGERHSTSTVGVML